MSNYECYLTRFGKLIHTTNDRCIGRSLREYGEWAPGETALLSNIIDPGNVIIDVGANIGFHSLFFSRLTGPEGRVIAFEPEPYNHEILLINKFINRLDNLSVYPNLVGSKTEVVHNFRAVVDDQNRGATYFEHAAESDAPPMFQMALDDLKLQRCDLVKIDVEDHELFVIRGMQVLLKEQRPVIFFEQRNNLSFAEIITHLRSHGYACFWSVTPAFPTANMHGNTVDFFKGATETNVLAIPAEKVSDYTWTDQLDRIESDVYAPPALSSIAPREAAFSFADATLKEHVESINELLKGSFQPL